MFFLRVQAVYKNFRQGREGNNEKGRIAPALPFVFA